ncbi:MAG: DUF805 domain-containing protein [Elusimicrobiaceae bacterium]|nr:DUF805 domain-containing protein [Elusimicrobiaceae bacterium]
MKTYFLDVICKHYVDFSGRATRKQFWLFVLWSFVVFFVLGLVFGLVGISPETSATISKVLYLAIFLPSLGIAARRLRDGGFSPWWLLIGLVPFIGWIVLLVFYCLPSKN